MLCPWSFTIPNIQTESHISHIYKQNPKYTNRITNESPWLIFGERIFGRMVELATGG